MNAALAAFALAPGLAVGSFLNVLAVRVPLRRSVIKPRSACMSCGTELAWYDNLPLVSYAVLKGRCRTCGTGISPLYPAVELATALLVAACAWRFGLTGEAAVAAFFCAVLVAVTATDLTHRIVPNRIVVPAAAIVLVAHTALEPRPEWALAALGASFFLFAAALAYPAGMGMGDVKLALLMKRLSARPSRLFGAQDGHSVRALPGSRERRSPLRRGDAFARLLGVFHPVGSSSKRGKTLRVSVPGADTSFEGLTHEP